MYIDSAIILLYNKIERKEASMATSKEKVQKILSGEMSLNSIKSADELDLLFKAGLNNQDVRNLIATGKVDVPSLSAKILYELVTRDVLRVREATETSSAIPKAVSAEWDNDDFDDFDEETNDGKIEIVNGVPVVYLSKIKTYGLTDSQKSKFQRANDRMPKIEESKPAEVTSIETPVAPIMDEDEQNVEEPSIAEDAVTIGETPENEVESVQREFYDLPQKVGKNTYSFERDDHIRIPICLAPKGIDLQYVQKFDISTLESSYKLFLGDAYDSSQVKQCIADLKGAVKDSKSLKINKIKESPKKFRAAMEKLSCLFTYDIDSSKINYSELDKWAQKKYANDPEKYKKFLNAIVTLNDPNNKTITDANKQDIKQAKINLANYIGEYEADIHKNDLAYRKKLNSFLDITAVTGASIVGGLALRYLMAIPANINSPWGLLMLCLSVNGVPVVGIMAGLALASTATLIIAKIIKHSADNIKKYNNQKKALKDTKSFLAGHKQGLAAIRKKYAEIGNATTDDLADILEEPQTKEAKAEAKKDKQILDIADKLELLDGGALNKKLSTKKSLAGKTGLTKKIAKQIQDDIVYTLFRSLELDESNPKNDKELASLTEAKNILATQGLEALYSARLKVALAQAKKGKGELMSIREEQLANDLYNKKNKNKETPITGEVASPEAKKIRKATKLGLDRKLSEEEYDALRASAAKGNIETLSAQLTMAETMKYEEAQVRKVISQLVKTQKKQSTAQMKADIKVLNEEQRTDADGNVKTQKEIAKATKKLKAEAKSQGKEGKKVLEKLAEEEKARKEKYQLDKKKIKEEAKEGKPIAPKAIIDEMSTARDAILKSYDEIKQKADKKAKDNQVIKDGLHEVGGAIASGLKKAGATVSKPFRALFPPREARTGTTLGGTKTSVKDAKINTASAKPTLAK